MNFNVTFIDELAAQEHRHELEEQARVERLIHETEAALHPDRKHFSLIWWLLHLRRNEQPSDSDARKN